MAKHKKIDQEVQKVERLFILDEETKFLAELIKDSQGKIISTDSELGQLTNSTFKYENILILVELSWKNTISQLRGYEVAKTLFNMRSHIGQFNLAFISTFPSDTLLHLNTGRNRVFTQKFPHFEITDSFDLARLSIPVISTRKFDYLKNYCLLESGILDRLEHDIRNIIANPEPVKLSKFIGDVNSNTDILSNEIVVKTNGLVAPINEDTKQTLSGIHQLIQYLQKQYNNPGTSIGRKSDSKILLVEDDPLTLQRLNTQFEQYFNKIQIYSTGTEAYKELEKNACAYDAVITDMELLNGEFDDEKLGIDILELCEDKYPFLVTRVITSLPKNALRKLIGKNFGEIIFKSASSENVIPPFENLVEFVQLIDKEVKQRRLLRNMKGPVGSWWGKYLTRQLYLTQIIKPEKFSLIWNEAVAKATTFITGGLDTLRDNEKLSVEFKQLNEISNVPESGWEIIELLLTHRLVALWFAAKHGWDEFYYTGTGSDAYTKLSGFQSGIQTKSSSAYFTTILGLSAQGASKKQEERVKCKILPKNLFPQESKWLEQNIVDSFDSVPLFDRSDCDDVYNGVFDLLKEYNDPTLSEDVTYGETIQLLKDFAQNFPDERDIQKNNRLKEIFQLNILEYIDQLPHELSAILTKIREEVFYL